MNISGAVTLGDIADKLPMLEVACSRCERRGRLSVAKLIQRHGADARLTNLRTVLAGDCPRVGAAIYEQCGVHYPQLVRLWRGGRLILGRGGRSLSPGRSRLIGLRPCKVSLSRLGRSRFLRAAVLFRGRTDKLFLRTTKNRAAHRAADPDDSTAANLAQKCEVLPQA